MWDKGRKGSEQDMVLVGDVRKEGRKRQTTPDVFVCRDKLQTVIITIIIVPVEFHGGVTWVKVLGMNTRVALKVQPVERTYTKEAFNKEQDKDTILGMDSMDRIY